MIMETYEHYERFSSGDLHCIGGGCCGGSYCIDYGDYEMRKAVWQGIDTDGDSVVTGADIEAYAGSDLWASLSGWVQQFGGVYYFQNMQEGLYEYEWLALRDAHLDKSAV